MYEKYYSFREKPFRLTPDPEFLYLSKQHQGALDHMTYGIRQQEGFMAIVGDVGTGKTTLCRRLLEQMDSRIAVALVLNPMLSDMDLLRTCVHDLGVSPLRPAAKVAHAAEEDEIEIEVEVVDTDAALEMADSSVDHWVNSASKKELIDALNHFLIEQHKKGGATVLIIDEAQNLPLDVMEQLRILSNLETEKDKLLQIIFVGQLELYHKLRLPELKQLNQRIAIRYEVTPLSQEETRKYINHRLKVAGVGSKVSFSSSAVQCIYQFSKGYPRLINLACDRTLLAGYNSQTDYLEAKQAKKGIESLGLQAASTESRIKKEKSGWRDFSFASLMIAFMLAWFGYTFLDSNMETQKAFTPIHTRTMPVPEKLKTEAVIPSAAPANEKSDIAASVQTDQAVSGDKFRIQVGEFKSAADANFEADALREFGFQVLLSSMNESGEPMHTVYVGPYNDKKSASIHVQALKYSGREPILLSVSDAG